MMAVIPPFYGRFLPEKLQPTFKPGLTGLTVASFETFVLCPLERLKVWTITCAPGASRSAFNFFAKYSMSHCRTELFRGLHAQWARQVTSWVSYLVLESNLRSLARRQSTSGELSSGTLLGISCTVGVANTAITMPIDTMKTLYQRHDKPVETGRGMLSVAREVVAKSGTRGLYLGWPARMAQYVIQASITVPLLEMLDKRI